MFVGCNCFRKGAASNELQILTCDPKERIIQLTSRYDPAATCTWVVAPPLGLAILDVPAAPGFILLSWTGGFLLLDLRTPNSPQKAAVYRFQRNLDDEEGSLNSVAASALLQLNSQGRDSACKENSISERESFVDAMDVDIVVTNHHCMELGARCSCWPEKVTTRSGYGYRRDSHCTVHP